MALPRAHVEKLEQELAAHEQRLAVLRERIERLSQEAYAHELIIGLGRNVELITALDHVRGEKVLQRELTADPRAFFGRRGIQLPAGGELAAQDDDGVLAVSMRTRHAGWDYSVVWHAREGFSLVQHAVPGATAAGSANANRPDES
jgi:hypothetical protein